MAASDSSDIRVYRSLASNDKDRSFLSSNYDHPDGEDNEFVTGSDVFLRYGNLVETFTSEFHKEPEYIARSPGRVNLIGEHIDYEGYSVLPMAIKQDTIVGIGRSHGDEITVRNVQEGFGVRSFSADFTQPVDMGNHSWTNYVQAAYKGVFEYLHSHEPEKMPQKLVGLNLMISGQVPQGSGLSSSAAIVCASALAVLGYYGVPVAKWRIAEFTARCEKYVGTESGGMDQAISIMGDKGLAKLVHFKPHLHTEDVPLPQGVTFVVANSLTRSAKAEAAPRQYNMRVVECRLAAAVLGLRLGMTQEQARGVMTLSEVEPRVMEHGQQFVGAKGSLQGAIAAVVSELLNEDKYTHAELEGLLGEGSLEHMFANNASQMRSLHVAAGNDDNGQPVGFRLRQRALHVYSEKERVPLFKQICDGSAPAEEKTEQLARLMNDSQASCRDLYECSCEELDHLIQLSRQHGAEASRLTGAGWGGCTVSLVKEDNVEGFIQALQQDYYETYERIPEEYFDIPKSIPEAGKHRKPKAGWTNIVFASRPSSGGAILKLSPQDAVLLQ